MRDLTNEDLEAILREILLNSSKTSLTRLPNGIAQLLAEKYGCHHSTIRRVFAQAKQQGVVDGNMKVLVASRKKGKVGRKMAFTADQVKAKLLQVPSEGKLGLFRSHLNAIRPFLTEANKYCRMKFAFKMVRANMELNDMMQSVHLDEKWLYLTKTTRKYYLVTRENEPKCTCKSKRTSARNVDELVANVEAAFVDYPSERLDRTFLTLQACMIETLKCRGDNAYKVPHQVKEKQARQGRLPESLLCPLDVYKNVKGELDAVDRTEMERVVAEELHGRAGTRARTNCPE
ncbi:hypothetical protein H310_12388 [Aphanomyces invadans]|uniref:Uncharacterized protein n=1 Tax=Aphanomyces invadans TaxID=157072 RepID=A0A024TJP6_9STRA|nr:hypothetical protein H310_12388 [Aphanomyces invadans]ETV93826.1 hypothetical protein H310_12388 [Aphanomyces invadans]|eukprot:XP_008877635.1 hypothetical protein H310_12388 [Aphanomyces invadans]